MDARSGACLNLISLGFAALILVLLLAAEDR